MKILLALLISLYSIGSYCTDPNKMVVAVMDSGLDLQDARFKSVLCESGHKDFTGEGLKDLNGHGTMIAGLIKKYAKSKNYCLVIIKIFNKNGSSFHGEYQKALNYLYTLKPDVVNMSLSSAGAFIEEEYNEIKDHPKTIFVVAAGNDGVDLRKTKVYPAQLSTTFSNMIVVGALDTKGNVRIESSNYGFPWMKWEIGEKVISTAPNGGYRRGTGTSAACAIHTGKYLK